MSEEKGFAPADISASRIEKINSMHIDLLKIFKKGAVKAFEIGKELRDIWGRMDESDPWTTWCKGNLVFDASVANRYLRIYENFKDNPKLLRDQTIGGALKLLSAPQKEKEEITRYGDAEKRPETPWEQYFELPPLGRKVQLRDHRFEQPNSRELYLIRRGVDFPIKMADIHAPGAEDSRLKTARQGMMEGIQIALEMYYQEIERLERLHKKEKKKREENLI